jgi:hypothetical protein
VRPVHPPPVEDAGVFDPLARRAFIVRLLSLLPPALLARAAWARPRARRADAESGLESAVESSAAAAPLDDALLLPLASAVLPSELGEAGNRRAASAFQAWLAAYRPEAELLHGYGSGEIRRLPLSPAPAWRRQLAALGRESVRRHRKPFGEIDAGERRAIVRSAIGDEKLERMPSPLGARHVAVALIAHFYASPEATDLCYEAEIGRTRCRPLAASPVEPVPLRRRSG